MTRATQQPTPPGGTFDLAGHSVARVGFGAMQLAESFSGGRPPSVEAASDVLRQAIHLGVNHIDTAEFYARGAANQRIRDALAPYADDLAIVSKVGAEPDPQRHLVPAQRPEQLRAAVEANLRSLDVERLAAVNLRRMDAAPGIVADGDQQVDLDSQLAELVSLRDEGKIGGIGLSNVSREQFDVAQPAGIVCVQNAYSMVDRTHESLLQRCRELGVAWVPFFPLGSAFPQYPKVTDVPAVVAVAARLAATPAQVGLAWLLAHSPNILLIPGTANPEHLAENVAAGSLSLDDEAVTELDAVGLDAQA